ncbi:serine/arginine repetitive matrix protein 2-like isoform X3 [Eriocheir sinensis]|uniref:serine/arginine repetitive matrix protein 2-like isoform X3 n=1 Tax=Eriocheir sinensis TaxID=95602 RepID=UPI0021C8CC1E|nr:serine/arginine repetitive matrix protein 2-like isoform X3 [Eriocheir sinensis]
MNGRDPFFPGLPGPWSGYTPGTHSVYSSPPRFPYNVTGGRSHQGYVPGGVVHGPSPYLGHATTPSSPYYGRGGADYYAGERRAAAVSPSARRRLRALEDDEEAADPVVFNAGVTFRLGRESHVHRHVEVQPAHATPEAPSAALTRQIDKFLRKSDHALDRYKGVLESRSSSMLAGHRGRSATPGLGVDSPDVSLSMRAQRSASAASIAVKADKHFEALGSVGRRSAAPIAEHEEDDDFDSSSSDSFDDLSEDTSADLSKLDDLSSDSDDEYFDVVPLPGLRPPPLAPSLPSPQQRRLSPPRNPPAHSRSLPAVNKGPPKKAMGNVVAPAEAPTPQGAEKPPGAPTQGGDTSPAAPQQASAPPTLKTAAPTPPPATTPPAATALKAPNRPAPQPPAGQTLGRGGDVPGKGDTLKKYPAPRPPKDAKEAKDSKDSKDTKEPIKDGGEAGGKQENRDNKQGKQKDEQARQEDKHNRTDRPEGNKGGKQRCDTPEKSTQNKANSSEAPPRPETAATPVTSGVTGGGGDGTDAEKPPSATPKPRRAPSFKKYPAPQPPASGRPRSDGVTLDAARGDIAAASSGSVPSLLMGLPGGERKASDAQTTHLGGKAEAEKTGGAKQPPQSPTAGSPSPASASRKMRGGSPVPEKVLSVGKKAPAAPVLTGKLEIATSDGAATVKQDSAVGDKVSIKVAARKDSKGGGDNAALGSKATNGDAKDDSKGRSNEPKVESKPAGDNVTPTIETTKGESKDDSKVGTKEVKVESAEKPKEAAPVEDKNIPNGVLTHSPSPEKTSDKKTKETSKTKPSKPTEAATPDNPQTDETSKTKAKGKVSKTAKNENEPPDKKVNENPLANGTHEAGEDKAAADENSKYKNMNGAHNENDPPSTRGDTRSRSSSIASDAASPDVSQKSSGSKRSKGGKLAGIMNKFEVEDSSKSDEKVKPKAKVGKISGLASVFEGGKEPPLPKQEVGPKPMNIAGISTSKFGGVARFKKPVEPKKKDEDKPSSSEKDKSSKESAAKKQEEVNGVAEATDNEQEAKKSSSSEKEKSDKESSGKKKDKVNGVSDTNDSDQKAKKPSSSEKTGKSDKESSGKKKEVNGVSETADIDQKTKKPEKSNKSGKETLVKKEDQVNGVCEKTEINGEIKERSESEKQKSNKLGSPKKKHRVNGVSEGTINDQEAKEPTTPKTTEEGRGTPSTKKKNLANGVPVSNDSEQGPKKPIKSEKEADTKVKDKTETETQIKAKEDVGTDKKSAASEGPEALTNGYLLSEESSLSSLCDIEKDAAAAASDTQAAAGRGGVTQKATLEDPAKPVKEGDIRAKITGDVSSSAKGTKGSGEKETVSKGAMGKVEGSAAPTVKGGEVQASAAEAAKSPAAKTDTSRAESTQAAAAEQEVPPVTDAARFPPATTVTTAEGSRAAGKNESVEAAAQETEAAPSADTDLSKDDMEVFVDAAAEPPLSASPGVQSSTAGDVTQAGAKVEDAKTSATGEAVSSHASSVTLKETLAGPPEIKTPPGASVRPKDNSAANKEFRFDSDEMSIKVTVETSALQQQPGPTISIAGTTHAFSAESLLLVTGTTEAMSAAIGGATHSSTPGQLTLATSTIGATPTPSGGAAHAPIAGATRASTSELLALATSTARATLDAVGRESRFSTPEPLGLTACTAGATRLSTPDLLAPSTLGVANSSSAPQLSTLGAASGFSWKTNRIRRKLDDAIEHTTTFMLPRMESEVEALIREASDYLGPERRARRSWTPSIPGYAGSCPHLAASSGRKSQGDDEEEVFEDAVDPSQLDTLMPLPDVQAEREWRSRSRTPMEGPERSPSGNSLVAHAEALLSETDRLLKRSRSDKSLRRSYSRSLSNAALNKSAQEVLDAKCELLAREMLAEVTADLSEEHSTAHLAGERLEAEQAERMKLEKEVEKLQTNMRMMTTANGKLEMEKQALQSEVLNGEADHDLDEAADASLYKRKYEWCLREMELLKKQLKQQQEDDLDHLLLLKKQLEKKVADAYEETEEQRQVVAQVKRKSQRLQAEMNDLKILLEEQTSRNNLLEKKQRKFDQDMMAAQEELRHERANKDKIQREKDQTLAEKYSYEQEVATLKLELELKEEKVTSLNRELEDLNFTGKAEEEVAVLKKAKHDLELRVKDQEEELDDLAGQVQMLEGAKVRLEMSIEQMRKENRREVSQREEELEEVRNSAQKKVKALETQLENEHEERTLLVREKHELERRVSDLQDRTAAHVDEEYVHKLKKELKKTKALLRDTQTMLEKSQQEGGHKLLVRQLKTQLEDAEFAKTAAIKARQCAEADLSDMTSQLEEAQRSRKEAEDRCARVSKDRAEIQTQLEESEEEVAEVMKKYKSVVSQLSVDQITLSEQNQQIAELEHEKQVLHERLLELSSKVEVLEGETANIHTQRRLEMKIKEVESKLELEQTTRQRLESQISRLKDQLERVTGDCDSARLKESQAVEQNKRVARQLREAREDLSALQQRHTDAVNKKSEVEKQLELADSEVVTLKSDLKLAFKRIEDLQQAIQGDLNDSDSDLSDSDSDSDGSLSSYLTASLKQQMSSSNSTLRTPPSEVHQLERMEQPTSPCSEAISEDLEEAVAAVGRESFA